jgi:hypothetical protein
VVFYLHFKATGRSAACGLFFARRTTKKGEDAKMIRIIVMLFSRKPESGKENSRKRHVADGQGLISFWMLEGRRAYRESVIGDKIDRELWKQLDSNMWF